MVSSSGHTASLSNVSVLTGENWLIMSKISIRWWSYIQRSHSYSNYTCCLLCVRHSTIRYHSCASLVRSSCLNLIRDRIPKSAQSSALTHPHRQPSKEGVRAHLVRHIHPQQRNVWLNQTSRWIVCAIRGRKSIVMVSHESPPPPLTSPRRSTSESIYKCDAHHIQQWNVSDNVRHGLLDICMYV